MFDGQSDAATLPSCDEEIIPFAAQKYPKDGDTLLYSVPVMVRLAKQGPKGIGRRTDAGSALDETDVEHDNMPAGGAPLPQTGMKRKTRSASAPKRLHQSSVQNLNPTYLNSNTLPHPTNLHSNPLPDAT